jgi:hypothetical protein
VVLLSNGFGDIYPSHSMVVHRTSTRSPRGWVRDWRGGLVDKQCHAGWGQSLGAIGGGADK